MFGNKRIKQLEEENKELKNRIIWATYQEEKYRKLKEGVECAINSQLCGRPVIKGEEQTLDYDSFINDCKKAGAFGGW